MPGDKIFGSDFVDQSAHEEFKKLNEEADRLVKSFVEAAGGANAFREALSKASGIKQTTDEIKKGRQELTEMEKLMRQLIQTTERISVLDSQRAKALAAVREEARLMNQANKEESKLLAAKEGSYEQLDLQLRQMVRSYKALSEAERNAARGTELLDKLQKTRAALGALDANMGNWQRNVGNYQNQTFQLTQVLREMPAFAVSAQTGILGLSNNLPLLAQSFQAVAAQSGGAMAALKIFGASLFSFGNIFAIALGLFTIFSKQIFEFISGTKEADEATKSLNDSIGKETAKFEQLSRAATNHNLTQKERIEAANELKRLYPEALKNYAAEEIAAGKAANALTALRNALISVAMARAAEADLATLAAQRYANEKTLAEEKTRLAQGEAAASRLNAQSLKDMGNAQDRTINAANRQADANERSKKKIEELTAANKALDEQMNKVAENINRYSAAGKLAGGTKTTTSSGRQSTSSGNKKQDIKEWSSGINELDRDVQLMNEKTDQATIERVRKAIEEKKKLNAQYAKDELELIQGNLNAMERMWDQADEEERNRIRERVAALDQYAQFAQQLEDLGQAVVDITFAREMNRLDERQRRLTEYYDTEKQRIDASFTNQADKEREMMKLEAQREAQQKKIDQDRRAAERKRAQAQKAFDIASIITSTSLAVIKAYTEGDPYTKIPRALAAAAAGAISLARAIATPIPAYAEGTENHPGGPAIVGDAGVELVQEPGGRSYLTPNSPVIMDLPKKTKVIPHDELMQRVWNTAYVKMAGSGKVTTDSMAAAMIGAFEEMTDEIRGVRKAVSNIGVNVTLRDDSRAMAHIKSRVC